MAESTHNPAWELQESPDWARSRRLVDWLRSGSAFGVSADQVDVVETHISWVFLTESRAYKLKKPIRYDFLDFTTPELRRTACEEEVRLNRRLASSVYLGVEAVIRDANGQFQFSVAGEPIDFLVIMRRLRSSDALSDRIRSANLLEDELDRVVDLLVDFYRNAERPTISAESYCQRLEKHVRANHAQLLRLRDEIAHGHVQRAHAAQLQMLQLRPELLIDRVAGKWILEGHGDLRPEHIFLEISPQIIDCIEFDKEYRQVDVADELSFLAMECDHLEAGDVGAHILQRCQQLLGDRPPPELSAFYKSYRACVRAKVLVLRADQTSGSLQDAELTQARDYLRLAATYADRFPPLLIVVGGLMGTGKSTLAAELSRSLAAEWLRTDALRQELQGRSDHPAHYGEGPYHLDNRMAIYNEMHGRADRLLSQGLSVVMDGTFLAASMVQRASQIAQQHRAIFLHVRCSCSREVSLQRIADRLQGKDPSEARPELYNRQKQEQESPPVSVSFRAVDTERPLQQQVAAVRSTLAELLRGHSELSRLAARDGTC